MKHTYFPDRNKDQPAVVLKLLKIEALYSTDPQAKCIFNVQLFGNYDI